MSDILRVAQFSASDSLDRILEDLACPACGHRNPTELRRQIVENKLRVFCDGCGAFITIVLTDEQIEVMFAYLPAETVLLTDIHLSQHDISQTNRD
jgi:hypothetical protein